ncbi:CPBP family intramembrane metalloprotease [Nostoc sp. FACHB-892]|uniref:CPBP family intramembrane glutamic endopeptidase n=1 Tax=Nostoc sp. FACHB-892 TaxID=2692843 RepID=UPI0016885353|nr:type II CAAX endopeptidase family protein [Nostoc sp. FACHB-892]MBD2730094.1 CPBP family intramembrane metalloprotease [Nostoc sp. FACHB-892]
MEIKKKEKAINQILLGLALKFVPLITLGLSKEYLNTLFSIYGVLISFLTLGFVLVGYGFFIKGCRLYIESKGYSSNLGWVGLLSLLGLAVLLLIPSKRNAVSLQDESSVNEPFDKINIPELFLYWIIALPVMFGLILAIFCLLNNLNFSEVSKNPTILSLLIIICYVLWGFILLKKSQKLGLDFHKIIGHENHVNLKLIVAIFAVAYAFKRGFNTLVLYNLSFILPKYVESYINEKSFTNISEMILWSFSVMILAPLIEEFIFRGIILQKWAIKWGVKAGILTSSLLFAIIHFRFDIIPLFLTSIILSILYFKTRSLITSILFHFFYNTTVAILNIIYYFSTSESKRSVFVSIQDYQASIQPLLSQRVFLIAISIPFIIYFIYKSFPKNNAIIPYYANVAKISETN